MHKTGMGSGKKSSRLRKIWKKRMEEIGNEIGKD